MAASLDMGLIQRGARLRRSPFFDATRRYGCKGYTVYNHMLLPIAYDDLEAEYWKLLNGVTVWDVGVERQVEITGPDGFAFTNLLTPRDLTRCGVGQGKYALITAEDGGIINDPVLLRLGENHFWLALADSDVLLWAKGIAYRSEMDVEIREPDVSPMQVQGPKSQPVVEALFGSEVVDLPYCHFAETDLGGVRLLVTRTGWSGEVGYEIYLRDRTRGDELWEGVMEAGEPYGIAPTGPCDLRRIEAGILNYDMTLENNPYEVGLGWQIDLEQDADFIGRTSLENRGTRGGPKAGRCRDRGRSSRPQHDPVAGTGRRSCDGVRDVGGVLTATRPERRICQCSGGVGCARHVPDGRKPSRRAPATVVQKPFVDPTKETPKS